MPLATVENWYSSRHLRFDRVGRGLISDARQISDGLDAYDVYLDCFERARPWASSLSLSLSQPKSKPHVSYPACRSRTVCLFLSTYMYCTCTLTLLSPFPVADVCLPVCPSVNMSSQPTTRSVVRAGLRPPYDGACIALRRRAVCIVCVWRSAWGGWRTTCGCG